MTPSVRAYIQAFKALNAQIAEYAKGVGGPDNRIFFLSIPPFVYGDVCKCIKAEACGDSGYLRVMIEKPFGASPPTLTRPLAHALT